MRNKTVKDSFTPLDKVYMVSIDDKLDDELMQEVRTMYILYQIWNAASLFLQKQFYTQIVKFLYRSEKEF